MATVKHLGLFPWCPYKDKQSVIDTLYFGNQSPFEGQISIFEGLKVPTSDAVAMFWRVKKWRVHGQIQASAGGPAQTIPFDVTVGPEIESEKNYVCRYFDGDFWLNIPWSEGTFEAQLEDLNTPTAFTFNIVFFYSVSLLPANFRNGFAHLADTQEQPQGQPRQLFVWNFASLSDGDGGIAYTQLSSFGGEGRVEYEIPVTFLDKTYSLKKYILGSTGEESFNITASEYWPYDPEDGGGPIYDSETGEQLRAFPQ
jgi:hypothetical protein